MPEPTNAISRDWIHAFYRAHHRALAAYGASLARSRDEAEDLVHEALAGMLAVRGAIENPEAYAYRAIRNRAFDRARRT
jgi:DNA-directed RNA polymerase specialized sigma24 family protein